MTTTPLLLKTLKQLSPSRPPVWFMRQAGRCLRAYRALRKQYSFRELLEDEMLTAKVSLLPLETLGVDAIIVFSDILVVAEALGLEVRFTNEGPRLQSYFETFPKGLPKTFFPNRFEKTYRALARLAKEKAPDTALIGFCGGPLTLFAYVLEAGAEERKATSQFERTIQYFYRHPKESHLLLSAITELTIEYLTRQADHGAEALMVFESWASILPETVYFEAIMPYVKKIALAVREKNIPLLFFPRLMGMGYLRLRPFLESGLFAGLGVDWNVSLRELRKFFPKPLVLQGNFDPRLMCYLDLKALAPHVEQFCQLLRDDPALIVNLGHGVLPTTPEENLRYLADEVRKIAF